MMAGLDSFSSSLPIDTVTKPLLDNLHLRAAFNIASAGIDLPDITVQLGDYEWRLHKSVICENSGFFRRALEGRFREADTKVIALHQDEPFTIGRAIEFMYESKYSILPFEHASEENFVDTVDLQAVMRPFVGKVSSFDIDLQADCVHSEEIRNCLVIVFADKYDMPLLLEYAFRALQRITLNDTFRVHHTFWKCVNLLTKERINRDEKLQELFANMLATGVPPYHEEQLKEWYAEYPEFACQVYQKQRLEIKSLKETNTAKRW